MAEQLHHQRLADPVIVLTDLTSLELNALHTFEVSGYVKLPTTHCSVPED